MKTAVAHGFNPMDPFSSGLMGTDPESDTPLGASSLMGTAALIKSLFQPTQPAPGVKKPSSGKPVLRGDGKGGSMVDPASAANSARISGENPLNYTQTQVGPASSREKDLADAAEHKLRRTQAELQQKKLVQEHQDALKQARLERESNNPPVRLPKSPTGQINVDGAWIPGDQVKVAADYHNSQHPWSMPTQPGPAPAGPQQFQDSYQLSQRMRAPGALAPHEVAATNPQDPQFQRAFSNYRAGIPTDAPRTPDEIAIYQMLMGQ